jgi:hypothetical protein
MLAEALRAYEAAGCNLAVAADSLGIPRSTMQNRVRRAQQTAVAPASEPSIEFPDFPEDDIPVEDIISHMAKRFEKRQGSYNAHTWFPIKVRDDKALGILFVGDPHIDDNGANWPVLKRHVEICRDTDGLHAINIGDTTNCWGGRLIRKYADQDTSAKTARRLAEWLLLHSGVRWLVWLYGNHEHMGDGMHVLAEMAKRFGTQKIIMHDWEARFVLQFAGGTEFRINTAHNFSGHSIWNPNHGPVKAARFGDRIDLLVCGHLHHWAISHWELPEQGNTPLMIRTRGYKHMDDFARKLGHYDQDDGQSIMVVFDPQAKTKSGQMMPFIDIERGAEYLTWLRNRA